jgi:dihydrolipoamide dehydrogenase
MQSSFDVVILGSGPAGYVAAIRAAQLKKTVALVEKNELGGVCLNLGCIPTKALLKSAEMAHWMCHQASEFGFRVSYETDFKNVIDRSRRVADQLNKGIQGLMRKHKVTVVKGIGCIQSSNRLGVKGIGGDGTETVLGFKHLIIATGASAKTLPSLKPDGKTIVTSREAMLQSQAPKTLGIVGGGAIGVEFAYFYQNMGTQVTVIEAMDRLVPVEDEEVSQALERSFKKSGIQIKTKTLVQASQVRQGKVTLSYASGGSDGFDQVLVAIGVIGNTEGIGLERVGIRVEKGHIPVNTMMQTRVPEIYAVGDVIGPPWLAHVASHEAIVAVEHLAGLNPKPLNPNHTPACTYCQPQIASVGMTEAKAKKAGHAVKVGRFPFRASGKAIAGGDAEGFVKLVFDAKFGELLGAHLIGHDVTEMISGLTALMTAEATVDELIHTIHPHPTCSEALLEAALDSEGRAIHI